MIKLGTIDINLLNVGNIGLHKLYLGNQQIWPKVNQLWTPAEITTGFWYDADDTSTFSLNGSDIISWNDKSGNNRQLTSPSISFRPSYSINQLNGKPVVDFLSTNRLMNVASPVITNGSFYIVVKAISPATGQAPFSFDASSTRNFGIINQQNAGIDPFLVPKPTFTNWGIISNIYNSSTNSILATYNGGLENGTFQFPITSNSFSGSLALGLRQSGSIYMNCQIAELIISLSAHDTDTRQRIEGYLAWKWGLESNLQITHPYKNNPPIV